MDLSDYGWDSGFRDEFHEYHEKGFLPARVIESNRLIYKLVSEKGVLSGKLSGRFCHNCNSKADYPTVGDWIAYKPTFQKGFVPLQGILCRRSKFSRKVAGDESDEQVVASNIDTIFIVSGLDRDYNIRRLERYVTLAAESQADYALILNKADLCDDIDKVLAEIHGLFPDIPVYSISALENSGLQQLEPHLIAGKTVVFLGSSGVGKTTIINRLLGEDRLKTGPVRTQDSRGRHVTTSKNIILLPSGGLVIDTPGLREIQLLASGEGLTSAFSEIEEYAQGCKYKACTHTTEPKCAVQKAVGDGTIAVKRLENYQKMQKEIAYNMSRYDVVERNKRKRFWKNISKQAKMIRKIREDR